MFARWPSLFIQASITDAAVCWPLAMFSPYVLHRYPAAVMRAPGSVPSGDVWEK